MQARYYDPVIGRFYSNDPIAFRDIHSFNRYAYGNNNPYKFVDPDGKQSMEFSSLFSAQTGFEAPQHMINKQVGAEQVYAIPKGVADNLGGKEFFKMTVQAGNIPTPPTVFAATVAAVVLASIYDEYGEAASAVMGKVGGKLVNKLEIGKQNGLDEFAEKAASQGASQITGLVFDAVSGDGLVNTRSIESRSKQASNRKKQ